MGELDTPLTRLALALHTDDYQWSDVRRFMRLSVTKP